MLNPPRPRTGKLPVKKASTATAGDVPRERRGDRRKRETRSRLLEAALRLMAEKGMDGVAINEITEAADVGFGSFYNHFESKEAIYAALLAGVFEEFGAALDRLVQDVTDPAEVISIGVRHALLRAAREPVWGKLLIREGFSKLVLERGLGWRLLRDIASGVKAGRFPSDDILMMCTSVGGTILAAISVQLQFGSSQEPQSPDLARLAFSAEGLPERAAAALLRTLGLENAEAEAIARRPLPSVKPEVATV